MALWRAALRLAVARGWVPPSAPGAARTWCRSTDGVNPDFIVSNEMPARWLNVHDCERPRRWREEFIDDEDCKTHLEQQAAGGGGAAAPKSSNYTDVIGEIVTLDDFYAAAASSAESDRLFVLKFYSKSCRACLRIAAKYRRLATENAGKIDCYEAELNAARELFRELDVQETPSIQIFHGTLFGQSLTRLASSRCKPSDFAKVQQKILGAHVAVEQKRGLLQTLFQIRRDARGLPRHQWVRTHDDIYDGDGVELHYENIIH